MSDEPIGTLAGPARVDVRTLNRRVVMAFLVVAVLACFVAAALLLFNARAERQITRDRALRTAAALSSGFDQEVAAVNYLLKGLSTSPALQSGDLKAFHSQLSATPVPEGSWLILQDFNGQVLNTLRPYGERLPQRADMPNYDELTARLRVRPWTVSGRLLSALTGGFIVGLSLGIPGPNRELKSWLTTILAEPRLNALLDAQTVAPGWTSTLYDRDLNPIASSNKAAGALTHKPPEVLRKELERVGPKSSAEGLVDAMDELGNPILVAYRRSDSTNWTVALSAPLEQVNAPLTDVARRLLGPGLLLLIVGGAAALFTARQVQRPLSSLSSLVASAQGEVAELSSQLLSLQEEERRRIARELHDSTVQHLVATNLGLTRLDEEIAQRQPRAHLTLKEVSGEVQLALTELRIFTYLLHPPDLASDGLAATLRNFVAGFGRRSELQVNLQIPDIIDEAPPAYQLVILRVVQEALANVHRHARASRIDIRARTVRGRFVVRIRDDGQGLGGGELQMGAPLGVGIPGMHARLRQVNGDLKITTGSWGTAVLAFVPMQAHS